MKKLPWGVLTGVCLILVIYLTASVIVAHLVMGTIAEQTNDTVTMFDTWWQTLIFVADIVAAVALLGSIAMFVLKKLDKAGQKTVKEAAE